MAPGVRQYLSMVPSTQTMWIRAFPGPSAAADEGPGAPRASAWITKSHGHSTRGRDSEDTHPL